MSTFEHCIVLLLAWTSSIQFAWFSPFWRWQRRLSAWRNFQQTHHSLPQGIPLIRPLRGYKPDLEQALRSSEFLLQTYGCHLICVLDSQDEAMALCQQVVHDLQAKGLQASICPTTRLEPGNHKVLQLTAGLAWLAQQAQEHPVQLYCDSDVDCTTVELGTMYQALQADAKRAAVWLPFRDHTSTPPATSKAILEESLQSFVYLGHLSPNTCVGKILLVQAKALQAVGGWQRCRHHVGEDMMLGHLWSQSGYHVWMGGSPARCWRTGENHGVFLQRLRRWLLALREQSMGMLLAYPFLLATWPILLGLHGLAMVLSWPRPWICLGLFGSACCLTLSRYALGWIIAQQLQSPPCSAGQRLGLQWRGDWLLLKTAYWACWHKTIVWAGQEVGIEESSSTSDGS